MHFHKLYVMCGTALVAKSKRKQDFGSLYIKFPARLLSFADVLNRVSCVLQTKKQKARAFRVTKE